MQWGVLASVPALGFEHLQNQSMGAGWETKQGGDVAMNAAELACCEDMSGDREGLRL